MPLAETGGPLALWLVQRCDSEGFPEAHGRFWTQSFFGSFYLNDVKKCDKLNNSETQSAVLYVH